MVKIWKHTFSPLILALEAINFKKIIINTNLITWRNLT